MKESIIETKLRPIILDRRRLQLWRDLTLLWFLLAFVSLALLLIRVSTGWESSNSLLAITVLAAAGAGVAILRASLFKPSIRQIAHEIERDNPELHALLLTALDQQPDPETGELNYLQDRVVQQALEHHRKRNWEHRTLEKLFFIHTAHGAALATFFIILATLETNPLSISNDRLAFLSEVNVIPGDAEVERGSALLISARFETSLPADASLVFQPKNGTNRVIPLQKNLKDPVFAVMIPEVTEDFEYHVVFGEDRTRGYDISVFEYPALVETEAVLDYPEYTQLENKTLPQAFRISAVQGTGVDLNFKFNKPLKAAHLAVADGETTQLPLSETNAIQSNASFELTADKKFKLWLEDEAGRTNRLPYEFVLQVVENRPPKFKILFPPTDRRVSALEETELEFEVVDDFGVQAQGIAFRVGAEPPQIIPLGEPIPANITQKLAHTLDMEDLGVAPRQLISWYAWADDAGPDGETRRSFSDMFFLNVRPFEEIFRENQGAAGQSASSSSQSQQGGQGNPSQQLLELQKEVLTATWNQSRKINPDKDTLKEDISVIVEAQEEAVTQASQLGGRAEGEDAKKNIAEAIEAMEKAIEHLAEVQSGDTGAFSPAIDHEQRAYDALLRINPDEFEVTQGQPGGGGGGGGGGLAQQLNQLDLRQAQNRYETERQAQQQRQQEQQTTNRLKELARRQQDINERLRELQTSLAEAKTEEEQRRLERELKRLQDEQNRLVADLDSVRQDMNQSSDPQRRAQASEQLEQTRENLQRASEDLSEGEISQALASGRRAEQNLEQLREDYRQQTASEFEDEMRQMREQARQLAQEQDAIQQELKEIDEAKGKSLSDSSGRQELSERMEAQKAQIEELLNNMRQVTEQAENTEPLLAQELYDTLRQQNQTGLDQEIDTTAELLRKGFVPQARELERRTNESVDKLAQSVERAAESVLGSELEALRLARAELDSLTRELERELEQESGRSTNPSRPGMRNPSDQLNTQTNRLAWAGGSRLSSTNNPSGGNAPRSPSGQQGQTGQNPGEQQQAGAQNQPGQPGQGQGGQQPGGQQPGQGQQQASTQGEGEDQGQGQGGQQPGGQQPGQGQQQASAQGQGEGQGQGQGQGGQQPGQGQQQASTQGQGEGQGQGQGQGGGGAGGGNGNQPGGQRDPVAEMQRRLAELQNEQGEPREGQGGQQGQGGRGQGGRNNGGGGGGPENGGGNGNFWAGGQEDTGGPIAGEGYRQWTDRLRDVEEMLSDPALRGRVNQILDRVRTERAETKRNDREPQWDLVQTDILEPLAEVSDWIRQEVLKREKPESLVPIDREPPPSRFRTLVDRYYRDLGASEGSGLNP